MKSVALIAVFCFLGAHAYPKGSKIIGGQEASAGQFPFIVSLQDARTRSHFCGGGIISDRLIVTAGHCFADNRNPANSVVYAGTHDLNGGGTYYTLSRVVVNENFNGNSLFNDITLLQTSTPITLGPNVSVLKLPSANLTVAAGTQVTALGWGTIRYPLQQYPAILHYVPLGVVDNAACQRALGETIAASQICVGGDDGKGLCYGDSGSPLVLNGDTTVGIVSWGEPCGIGYPDVFTRVSSFVDWIQRNQAALEALEIE